MNKKTIDNEVITGKKKPFHRIFYIVVVLLSVTFLFVGNQVVGDGMGVLAEEELASQIVRGRVTGILERVEEHQDIGWDEDVITTEITFLARISHGRYRGREVTAQQQLSTMLAVNQREVQVGDRVLLGTNEWTENHFMIEYIRTNYLLILGAVFFLLVILFGGIKGINALVALGFTCLAIFFVFVPALLSGRNIYITTIIICVYSILSTLFIVIGPNRKAVATMIGCMGGVFLAGGLMFFMDTLLQLTGFVDQDMQALLILPTTNPIDLSAIIFAGVIIGAVGAILDVSMSIASSLWEVRLASGNASFWSIFKAGINIGRDILGTMLNTLILAYIGSSLSLLLLIVAYTTSFVDLMNREMIVAEVLRALVGSFGMLLTIPLTAAICSFLYPKTKGSRLKEQRIAKERADRGRALPRGLEEYDD
jgi:uncharacterized membrane protein